MKMSFLINASSYDLLLKIFSIKFDVFQTNQVKLKN